MPDSASGVSSTRFSPNSLLQPLGHPEDAAERADVLAHEQDLRSSACSAGAQPVVDRLGHGQGRSRHAGVPLRARTRSRRARRAAPRSADAGRSRRAANILSARRILERQRAGADIRGEILGLLRDLVEEGVALAAPPEVASRSA